MKVALVTGGSRGIGRAVCVKLAAEGYHVLVNYVSNDAAAKETLEQMGGNGELLKFDVADYEATAKAIDRPVGSYSVAKIVELMKKFDGKFTMQTMFLEGDVAGRHINNMTDEEVSAWLDVVKATKPKQAMIYTIDRATPEQNLRKATHDELDAIRDRVKAAGFEVSVSY